jgi:hypothetical protein
VFQKIYNVAPDQRSSFCITHFSCCGCCNTTMHSARELLHEGVFHHLHCQDYFLQSHEYKYRIIESNFIYFSVERNYTKTKAWQDLKTMQIIPCSLISGKNISQYSRWNSWCMRNSSIPDNILYWLLMQFIIQFDVPKSVNGSTRVRTPPMGIWLGFGIESFRQHEHPPRRRTTHIRLRHLSSNNSILWFLFHSRRNESPAFFLSPGSRVSQPTKNIARKTLASSAFRWVGVLLFPQQPVAPETIEKRTDPQKVVSNGWYLLSNRTTNQIKSDPCRNKLRKKPTNLETASSTIEPYIKRRE